jgi:CarD family transcriptional regulator
MPSVKKIAPKAKASAPAAKSAKPRGSKSSTSKTKSKEKPKTAAKRVSVQKNKTTERSELRAKSSTKRPASTRAAKNTAPVKTAQARTARGKTASPSTSRGGRAAAAGQNVRKAAKRQQAVKKTAKAQVSKTPTKPETAATVKREQKTASLPTAVKKVATTASQAPAKVSRATVTKKDVTALRKAAAPKAERFKTAPEAVASLAVAKGPMTGAGEARALPSAPAPATFETSDHQTVAQKTQKKTAATPVAEHGSPAAKIAVAPVMLTAAAKPAAEKTSIVESKPREASATATTAEEAKPADKPVVAAKPAKPANPKPGFKTAEFIVYPAHGVGQIIAIEEQEVAGFKLELFVVSFVKDKMILKVPVPKATSVGMRKLGSAEVIKRALTTLTGRARIKRTMWSRRAQEYEAKINSGDLVAIAEVVRDLYRSEAQPEQSYSERQLYEAALDRVAREISVVQKLTETESLRLIDQQLQKGPRRGKVEEADSDIADGEDGDIDEAA